GGTPPLRYQWRFNGASIIGATNSSLLLTNVQFALAGNYSVVVSNAAGGIVSSNAPLTVFYSPATILAPHTKGSPRGIVAVAVTLAANGNENAMGFSLNFYPRLLTYAGATVGAGASGGVLMANTSLLAGGKLGLAVALPMGTTFLGGTQQIARV